MSADDPSSGTVPTHPDFQAMNEIALLLGRPRSWARADAYLEEIAQIITATGRPDPREISQRADARVPLNQFTEGNPCPPDAAVTIRDWHALNDLTELLAETEWTSATLESVAGAVAWTGRPHPDGSLDGAMYETALALWSGSGPRLPTGTLVITVDDADLPDNPFEPWTATASWQTDDGSDPIVGVGGGPSIPAALRDLALELEAHGITTGS